ncbi:MAG: hypothetical protein J5686_02065 [Bacteroidales bacterium]|nr:hypothetical protein [Bacteroidales bacterium]
MKTAKIISIIGHPIFHPTWMMILLLLSGITRFTPGNDWTFLTITLSMTCLLPILVIVMLKKWHFIESYEMDERDDRLGPLFIMVLFLFVTLRFFNKMPLFSIYNFYLTTVIVTTILAFVITFFWKISLHALGWGNLTACLFIMTTVSMRLYLLYFLGSVVISGIVAAARLKLKSHSNAQIYSGFAMGFATVIVVYFLSMI